MENKRLRELLALRMGIENLYTDDGELQFHDGVTFIDFRRDSVDKIEAGLIAVGNTRAGSNRMRDVLERTYKRKRAEYVEAVSKQYDPEFAENAAESATELLYWREAIDGYPKDRRPEDHLTCEFPVEDRSEGRRAAIYDGQIELYEYGKRVAYCTPGGHWIPVGHGPYSSSVLDSEWMGDQVSSIMWKAFESEGPVK